ncbi:MAG: glycosyltransferase family 2 protein [Oceanospirillaceae bacterium]|nr:glycosyltransferase family 2 protein [Oceanospirillaceae bacterium]
MKISVIIPTKNRQDFLKRSLGSVLNQVGNNSELEVVIVNDGSTDGTKEYLDELKNPKVIAIHNEQSVGGGKARNLALEKATGDFVAFLDDDDFWKPNKIAIQEKYLSRYSFVGSKIQIVSGSGKKTEVFRKFFDAFTFTSGHLEKFNNVFLHRTGISPSCVIMSRKNLQEIGGFDPTLKANQGRDLFIRYALAFGSPYVIHKRLVIQYQNHGGRISSNTENRIEAQKMILERYESNIPKHIASFDRARTILRQARSEKDGKVKSELEREAISNFSFRTLFSSMKLFAIYQLSK